MRSPTTVLTVLLGVASATPWKAFSRGEKNGFTIAHAGGVAEIVIEEHNTLNGTYHTDRPQTVNRIADSKSIKLNFVNNLGDVKVKIYIQGLDSAGKVVFVRADGTLYYPTSGGSPTPVPIYNDDIAFDLPRLRESMQVTLTVPLASARVYFAEGILDFFMVKTPAGWDGLVQPSVSNTADPSANTNWGFIEFTYSAAGGLFANVSYVDFVGMVLGMSLSSKDRSTQLAKGLTPGAVESICHELRELYRDGPKWKALCVVDNRGGLIRVLSPNIYSVMKPSVFKDYWRDYVDKVWKRFSESSLTIDTQGTAGKVDYRVVVENGESVLKCDLDNRPFTKPSAEDIWGCNSGPFAKQPDDSGIHLAAIPRLCAAFHRSLLLMSAGQAQPLLTKPFYYNTDPTNHYSRLVHKYEADGRGYAFSYDDVSISGEDVSGTLASESPQTLTVYVGGYI